MCREESQGDNKALDLSINWQQTNLFIRKLQEGIGNEGGQEVIEDDLHSEPPSKSTEIETVAPNSPLGRILFVHSSHVAINHAPRDWIILRRCAIIDLGLERHRPLVIHDLVVLRQQKLHLVIRIIGHPLPGNGQDRVGDKVCGHNVANVLLPQVQRSQETQGTCGQDAVQAINVVRPAGEWVFVRRNYC